MAFVFRKVTIYEFERGLKYSRGRFAGVLEPGEYWIYAPRTRVERVDIRPAFVTIPGQEVLSSDGVTLRVSLAAEYEIADPEHAINSVEDFRGAIYLTVQLALRDVVGSTEVDELLASRATIGASLLDRTAPEVAKFGVRLLSVEMKDIMFPGDLKKMMAQVVQARKEGQAALEKARGETAALRNLANAARLMESNPALMQLRLLQQLGGSSGNTVVLGLPGTTTPLPIRGRGDELPPPEAAEPKD
jgi:regulator of protease activity HflC (stomatin/prohibitin superfamily)